MRTNKNAARKLKSDLAKVDAHVIQPHEYDGIPELIDEDFSRGTFKRAGRPIAADPRKLVTIRSPASVLERWRESGAGGRHAWRRCLRNIRRKRSHLGR